MKRRTFIAGLGTGAVGATGTVAAQDSGDSGSGNGANPRRGSGSKSDPYVVDMVTSGGSYYFDPVGLYVEKGSYVSWEIKSGQHSATSYSKGNPKASNTLIPDGAKGWDSGVIGQGQFDYQFTVEGTYDYYCIPHKSLGMVGRIVCGKPGGPAEKTQIPDDVGSGIMPDGKTIVKKQSLSYPYIPSTGHGGPPALFWAGAGIFGAVSLYLFHIYDVKTGRYDEDHSEYPKTK